MVTVRSVTRERAFVCILLDTGERFWLRGDDLYGSDITEGASFDAGAFLQKIRVLQYPRALNHAVAMLARRPCSRGEIRSRLVSRRYTEDVAELVVYKLEKEKLLDDEAFCDQWIRFRSGRGYGRSVIRRELKMKGIPEEMIDAAFALLDPEEEADAAVRLARKAWNRIRPGEDIRKARQKVIASLVRKGYGWEEARAAAEKAENQEE